MKSGGKRKRLPAENCEISHALCLNFTRHLRDPLSIVWREFSLSLQRCRHVLLQYKRAAHFPEWSFGSEENVTVVTSNTVFALDSKYFKISPLIMLLWSQTILAALLAVVVVSGEEYQCGKGMGKPYRQPWYYTIVECDHVDMKVPDSSVIAVSLLCQFYHRKSSNKPPLELAPLLK